VDTSYAGDRLAGNGGDGLHVAGTGNRLFKNSIFANAGDGIEVSGGIATRPNVLLQNLVGDYAMGNRGNGILVHNDVGNGVADPVEIERNTVENNGEAGMFLATRNTANRVVIPGADGSAFPTGCLGTP
jgi:hypothetical protein